MNDIVDLKAGTISDRSRELYSYHARPVDGFVRDVWLVLWKLLAEEASLGRHLTLDEIADKSGLFMRSWVSQSLAGATELGISLDGLSCLQGARQVMVMKINGLPAPLLLDSSGATNVAFGSPLTLHPFTVSTAVARGLETQTHAKPLLLNDESNLVFGNPLTLHPLCVRLSSNSRSMASQADSKPIYLDKTASVLCFGNALNMHPLQTSLRSLKEQGRAKK